MVALIEISGFLKCYTLEDLSNKSEDWINAVYKRVVKVKRDNFKLIAMLNRYKDKTLRYFNTEDDPESEKQRIMTALELKMLDKRK